MKALYVVISDVLGNKFRCLSKRPNVLLTLASTLTEVIFKCFSERVWKTLSLLKTKGGWVTLFGLRLKITSLACLLGSRLKLIFHWKAKSLTFSSHHLTYWQKWLHHEQLKIMMHYQQKVMHWRSNYLINHLYKLRIIKDLE